MSTTDRNSKCLEHVLYEFWMYLETYYYFNYLHSLNKNYQFEINMTIESHELHLRNLMEFFDTKKPKNHPEDLRLSDILQNYDSSLTKEKVQDDFNHISRSVEHLTSHRTSIDKKETIDIINKYYEDFKEKIKKIVDNLESNITNEYREDLKDENVITLFNNLKEIFRL